MPPDALRRPGRTSGGPTSIIVSSTADWKLVAIRNIRASRVLVVNGVRAGSEIGVFRSVAVGSFVRMIGARPTKINPSGARGAAGNALRVRQRGNVVDLMAHLDSSREGSWLELTPFQEQANRNEGAGGSSTTGSVMPLGLGGAAGAAESDVHKRIAVNSPLHHHHQVPVPGVLDRSRVGSKGRSPCSCSPRPPERPTNRY